MNAVSNATTPSRSGSRSRSSTVIASGGISVCGGAVWPRSGAVSFVNSAVPRGRVPLASTVEHDRRPGVPAVVHPVVDELRVAPGRDARAQRVEVRLVRDRVLVVGEPVALVGQELEQRDREVGRVALDPVWVQPRQQVDQEPPEARVVLRHVVEERLDALLRRARQRAAVDVGRAAGHEREDGGAPHRVEAGIVRKREDVRRPVAAVEGRVRRVVPWPTPVGAPVATRSSRRAP